MVSSSARRVLVIDNSIGITGARKSIEAVVKILSNRFEFFLATPDPLRKPFFKKSFYFNFLEINKSFNIIFYLPKLFYNSIKLLRLIKKYEIDIIHVNDIYNLTGIIAKIIYPKFKLVHHVRLLPNSYIGPLYHFYSKLVLKYADKIICVSEAVFDALPYSSKKIMIYNALYEKEKSPQKTIKESEKIKLLCLGNLIPGKGQNLVIEAFYIVHKERKEKLFLEFVGEVKEGKKNNVYKETLLKKIEDYGLKDFITFKPFNQNIEKTIKDADIVINLSESESFSRVALEALFFGTPLIASDSGGVKELFKNGKSGILVPNSDVIRAARAVITLADDIIMRKKISKEGQKYVKEKFDLFKISEKMEHVYNNVLLAL